MGGGDLNMKKSWHPLLLKNQERVWLEEKKALEEKKKLDQLRKEKEEERQLQELQRLQEEQTGKKRTEKLEWMYATPATGSNQNPNDLEDYLLGKKRVDKILTGDENDKVGASHKNFIAVQNANTSRDIAAKIREDPLLAIKQQEQAAYQALLSNPLRLAKMQKELGVKPKKDKKEKKRAKEERRRLRHEHKHGRSGSRSPRRVDRDRSPLSDDYHSSKHTRSPRRRSRSRSPSSYRRRDDNYSEKPRRYSPEVERGRSRSRSRSPRPRRRDDSEKRYRSGRSPSVERYNSRQNGRHYRQSSPSRYNASVKRDRTHSPRPRSPPPKRIRSGRSPSPTSIPPPRASSNKFDEDRAARLAAMSANATAMSEDRQKRLAALLEKEKAELEADEQARARSKGMSGYLSQEQKRVFGGLGGLEDRIKRGRGGMVVDAD
ncbi:Pre-mRNA-splicing factor CWC25 [Psilocybe cubensis]|uniref:Pre-mRNA-splicing factor CWC25 n=2 Tax=Psilocybe cubensis TaxID=181762 RepID=A0ACB8HFD0_PSICU|nr:Pre-mRNA-splicing factor CWC25 [Psilocybe cubensis]KAH9486534.1 Pre-mRNA-splicing factor CWC25 [Psilocybe cubensis]